jgi:hypothetical protein
MVAQIIVPIPRQPARCWLPECFIPVPIDPCILERKMSMSLLDRAESRTDSSTATTTTSTTIAAQRLRTTMAAVRVSFTWFGASKTLTPEQRTTAAEAFDAEGQFLRATKKVLDTRAPAFRAVTAVRGKIAAYWKSQSLPFPEPGIRLIKQAEAEAFAHQMDDYKVELADAVAELDRHFGELKRAARQRLGSLYSEADYPDSLSGLFAVAYDFPSVEPPDYLVALCPQLYEQEQARVSARFEEAVRLAEQAFLEEFARLVEHLTERISGTNEDGSVKVFRDSAVGNLADFFARFRDLNVRSSAQLDALVDQAQRVVRGVGPQELRDSEALRQQVGGQLARVQASLDAMLIDRPRRRILRQPVAPAAGEA